MKLDLNNLKSKINPVCNEEETASMLNRDIAVIGMACHFPLAENIEEFWQILKNGTDCIRQFPLSRQKYGNDFLQNQSRYDGEDGYFEGGFLDHVDLFDPEFFGISPMEASLMSPDQRNFLQVVYHAIEDSGYGEDKLKGTRTGIFLGHSTDFGVSYKEFIDALNPDMASFAISGNLNGIIASRLSYLLDLKGPSVNVDTACSSALVAIHTACRSLRNKECSIAIAGACKIDHLPLKSIKKKEDELGITSTDGRTRTFDMDSEGTGLGEGIGVIILKPLEQAKADGDNIHAVIKGSAINQDGASANLTAPNPDAQADVIVKAWQDAKVHPESISYIEAHGTGTKLGDPIEINGINKAFRQYTDKVKFCGIGSVKSNIGHLDNAAGMAGIIKLILSLKHKAIPASLHYKSANEKISFEQSPVFVNSKYREWMGEGKLRCGISAFGLSGTNCHIILEEADKIPDKLFSKEDRLKEIPFQSHVLKPIPVFTKHQNEKGMSIKIKIFTMSARNKEELLTYLWKYQLFLNTEPNIDLDNLCFTANTGRNHYLKRLVILFDHLEDLKINLEEAYLSYLDNKETNPIFYREKAIVSDDMLHLCKEYINGNKIDWDSIYKEEFYRKISLPTYPFAKIPHWIETVNKKNQLFDRQMAKPSHPLLHHCLADSFETILYSSYFTVEKDWILKEHLVAGIPLIPGTVYIEMITEAVKRHFTVASVTITDLVFLAPLSIQDNTGAIVHTVIYNKGDKLSFTIASKKDNKDNKDNWILHAKGNIDLMPVKEESPFELEKAKERYKRKELQQYAYEEGKGIQLSKRWDCVRDIYVKGEDILAYLSIGEEYQSERKDYTLHPALMDEAANITLRTIGKGIYLPFSYKKLVIFHSLPENLYSYVTKKKTKSSTKELATFDVTLMDTEGNIIAKAYDYTIKRINTESVLQNTVLNPVTTYQLAWINKNRQESFLWDKEDTILILRGEQDRCSFITNHIKETANNVIEIQVSDNIEFMLEEFTLAIKSIHSLKKLYLVHLLFDDCYETCDRKKLRKNLSMGVYGFIKILKILMEHLKNTKVHITAAGYYENPENGALFGLLSGIEEENRHFYTRCIGFDKDTKENIISNEILSNSNDQMIFYKDNERFIEQLEECKVENFEEDNTAIREKGVYVITGGTGGVGLLIAEYLSLYQAKIILLNRSSFPNQDKWEEILSGDFDEKLKSKIIKQKELIKKGAEVVTYSVDISEEKKLEQVFDHIRSRFGTINGIFHGAGVAGNGFLNRRTEEELKAVLAPKTEGTQLLDRLTGQEGIDFIVLFSSVSSIFPEAGQCDYGAANRFMDYYARYHGRDSKKIIAINWPAFEETGMAVDYGVDFRKEIFKPIKKKEAISILDQVLHKKVHNLIAGQLNYINFMQSGNYKRLQIASEIISTTGYRGVSQKPKENNKKEMELTGGNGSYTKTEYKVASIIGNALGRTKIDISDSFLELGGNSILAVKVEIDMEEQEIPVSLSDLYAYPSIKELAAYIDNGQQEIKPLVLKEEKERIIQESGFVLEEVKPFSELIYKGCFNSAFLSGISHFHIPPMYFLGNDLVFYDFLKENQTESFDIRYHPIKSFEDSIKQAALTVKEKIVCEDVIEDIIQSLLLGRLVIVTVDCYYESISQDCYNKEHSPHSILVYGFNEEQNLFYIVEHSTSESALYEKMQITYEELKECYLGYGIHFKNLDIVQSKNGLLIYQYEQDCPTYFEIEKRNKKEIVTEEQLKQDYRKKLSECEKLGEDSLMKLKEFVKEFYLIISDETLLKEKKDHIIGICNNGISGLKVKQYQFNHLLKEKENLNVMLKEIIRHWDKIRNIVLKYSYTNVYRTSSVELIKSHMEDIVKLEMQLQKEIYN